MRMSLDRNTAVFYISLTPYAGSVQHRVKGPDGQFRTVYIRAEWMGKMDLVDALDKARPRKEESLMNSHYVD